MRAALGLPAAILFFSAALPAAAFDLKDHLAITRQAVREFQLCRPGIISDAAARDWASGNLDEDLDVVEKWALYSHYYNPERRLKMRRKSSLDRVKGLEETLRRASALSLWPGEPVGFVEGHILHHLQDSASPPHVVPITHGLADGFENFEPGVVAEPTPADLDCAPLTLPDPVDPSRLLEASARLTLAAIRRDPWPRFWAEGAGDQFGSYGAWGNSFGEASRLDLGAYREFKQRQVRQAIQVTKLALAWIVRLHRKNGQDSVFPESIAAADGR